MGGAVRLGAAALLSLGLGHAAQAAPRRIVSLNLCADELVLRLADRSQVAAVTWLARDPRGSTVSEQAAGVPVTRGLSEEIVALNPDLVIAGAFTTRTTVGMLKRIGFPPIELGVPTDFEGVRAQIRQVAQAVGHPERGEAMIADLDARLAAIPNRDAARRPRALVMRPNAFTVAPGTLGDAILSAAGFSNAGAEIGQDRTGQVPLEAASFADPDLIVLDEQKTGTPSLADTLLRHPVLRVFADQGRTLSIPNRLWTCPGPQIAEAVERLAAAREKVGKHADGAHSPLLKDQGLQGRSSSTAVIASEAKQSREPRRPTTKAGLLRFARNDGVEPGSADLAPIYEDPGLRQVERPVRGRP